MCVRLFLYIATFVHPEIICNVVTSTLIQDFHHAHIDFSKGPSRIFYAAIYIEHIFAKQKKKTAYLLAASIRSKRTQNVYIHDQHQENFSYCPTNIPTLETHIQRKHQKNIYSHRINI